MAYAASGSRTPHPSLLLVFFDSPSRRASTRLHRDDAPLRALRLGESDQQGSVLRLRADAIRVDTAGDLQRTRVVEPARPSRFEAQAAVLDPHLDALDRRTGHVGHDEELVGVLVDVDGRGYGAPAVGLLGGGAVGSRLRRRFGAHGSSPDAQAVVTAMVRLTASLILGRVTVKTPSLRPAVMPDGSTTGGSV